MIKTTEQYKDFLRDKFPNILCVSEYIHYLDKIQHKCTLCGNKWSTCPKNIYRGSGCPGCARNKQAEQFRKTTGQYIKDLLKHNQFLIYSDHREYKNNFTKRLHLCKCGHEWKIEPLNALKGNPCGICSRVKSAGKQRKTQKGYEMEIKIKSSSIVCQGRYKNSKAPIEHQCLICDNTWDISPAHILSGSGCPRCQKNRKYSKVSIEWLESISLSIQHAENGGEYRIPGTRFRVDGYESITNTVYEFLGDYWHGNPKYYKSGTNPRSKIRYKDLYSRTMDRFERIKDLGYNLTYIWESDYKEIQNGKKERLL